MIDLRDLVTGTDSTAVVGGMPDRLTIRGVTDDSRQVKPGWLFAALPGRTTHGRQWVAQAVANGAVAVLSDRPAPEVPAGVAQIVADDARKAWGQICSRFAGEPTRTLAVAGVTGTNGKTTTTYLLQHVFEAAGHRAGRIGTVGNDTGSGDEEPASYTTPPTGALHAAFGRMRDNGLTHAAIEVSSQALDQGRTAGVDFAAALFTNLTQDHLDYHGSMTDYAHAKARLFAQVRTNGLAAVNGDDPFAPVMVGAARCRVVTFGFGRHNAYRATGVDIGADGSAFEVAFPGGSIAVRTPLVGRYNVANALGVFALAHGMGVDAATIARSLATATGAPGRLERVCLPGMEDRVSAFVDYAHTPDALEKALQALRDAAPDRPLAVIVGCGGDRDRTKRPKMGAIAARLADYAVITSDNPRSEDPEVILHEVVAGIDDGVLARKVSLVCDRAEAIERCLLGAPDDGVVLVAGKGHETYQIVGDRTFHFDDREVVRNVLHRLRRGTAVAPLTHRLAG